MVHKMIEDSRQQHLSVLRSQLFLFLGELWMVLGKLSIQSHLDQGIRVANNRYVGIRDRSEDSHSMFVRVGETVEPYTGNREESPFQ